MLGCNTISGVCFIVFTSFERSFIMKRVVSCLLALVMTLIMPLTVFAADGEILSDVPATMQGVLTDSVATNSEDGVASLTYEFDVPMVQAAPTNGSTTVDSADGGNASRVYLTIGYSMQNTPTEYKLTSVSGRWTLEDSRVSVTSASLTYGCSGLFPVTVTQTGSREHVSNPFSISTGFKSYVVGAYCGVMGAHLTLTYLMGSSRTWTFTLDNTLFNT